MGAFFIYILKSSVCLVLFYLFFRLLLSRETFHRFNRVALLGVLFLSLLIPFIKVTTSHQVEVRQTMLTIEQLLLMAEAEPVAFDTVGGTGVHDTFFLSWVKIFLLIYLAGIIFLACRNLYSLFRLFRLIHSGKREKLGNGTILVVHEQEIAPFSWMRHIVISRKDLEEDGREILIHETAHVRHWHSVDLLIADVCIFFQWFNPGAWLLKQELQNIHEYEADETVINEGVNAKEYQLLLIKKAVGARLYSMANSFNHSKLKKRITMMLKEKSSPWARLKYLYVLPLAAVAVAAFARPEISEKVEEISAVKVNDLAGIVQENVLQDTVKVLHGNSKGDVGIENRTAKTKGNEEIVVFEVVEQMPEYPGGMDALYKYLEDKTKSSAVKGKAGGSVIVGFTVSESGKVKDVRVLQSDQSVLNGEAERIVREMPIWIPGKQRGVPVSVKYSVPVRFGDIRFPENKRPLIMVDGKEMSMEAFEKLDRGIIESVSVLKDSASVSIYGGRGANGVIFVTTQKAEKKGGQGMDVLTGNEVAGTDAVPEFPVTGIVTDEQGQPKAGVSIVIPNTTVGTITDVNGRFHLKAPKDSYLWFSFIGYKTVKAAVASEMSIRMEQEVVNLFPEVSAGLKITEALPSGMKVGNGIRVYGIEEEQPLIIIDGKEVAGKDVLSKLPNDRIKSVTILKDKSATAIYGERGKNGVMLVTMFTEGEYQFRKANPEKPYADALELAESVAEGVKGKIIYCIDDKEVKKSKLKGMSVKEIRSVSVDNAGKENIVRLKTDKYRSDWITVTGVVCDEDGEPTPAVVNVKGTGFMESTDSKGNFTIKAPENGVLRVGYNDKPTIEVKVKPTLKVVLKDK